MFLYFSGYIMICQMCILEFHFYILKKQNIYWTSHNRIITVIYTEELQRIEKHLNVLIIAFLCNWRHQINVSVQILSTDIQIIKMSHCPLHNGKCCLIYARSMICLSCLKSKIHCCIKKKKGHEFSLTVCRNVDLKISVKQNFVMVVYNGLITEFVNYSRFVNL